MQQQAYIHIFLFILVSHMLPITLIASIFSTCMIIFVCLWAHPVLEMYILDFEHLICSQHFMSGQHFIITYIFLLYKTAHSHSC